MALQLRDAGKLFVTTPAAECRPALILLDVKLPERSGGDLLGELRDEPATRDSAIVIVSANAHLLSETQLTQVDAIIPKPFDINELMAVVHRELQHAAARHAEVPPITATAHIRPRRTRRATPTRTPRGRR